MPRDKIPGRQLQFSESPDPEPGRVAHVNFSLICRQAAGRNWSDQAGGWSLHRRGKENCCRPDCSGNPDRSAADSGRFCIRIFHYAFPGKGSADCMSYMSSHYRTPNFRQNRKMFSSAINRERIVFLSPFRDSSIGLLYIRTNHASFSSPGISGKNHCLFWGFRKMLETAPMIWRRNRC
jgi:hypothetical protein